MLNKKKEKERKQKRKNSLNEILEFINKKTNRETELIMGNIFLI